MMKQRKNKSYDKFEKVSDGEETELFVRSKTPRREIPCVEKNIEEGDTLQSIAIRYHCTIEDIKRLNNIHRENEIYARNTIKVPRRPFSEALAPVHVSGSVTPENKLIDIEPPKIDIIDLSLKIEKPNQNSEVNDIIFNSQITHISVEDTTEEREIIDDEEVLLLPNKSVEHVATRMNCSGIDGDIPLIGIIVFIVVMIFAAPLYYAFYVAEHLEEYHHEQT